MSFRHALGFIGGGNMAEAIVRAAVERDVLDADRIVVSDPSPDRLALFAAMGVRAESSNAAVIAEAEQVVLAIKPQMLDAISSDLAGVDPARQVVISIMAGVGSVKIATAIGGSVRVVRVMPNTPLLVGRGMSAVSLGEHAREGDEALALKLLRAAGEAVVVDESLMDAVTAVSGSGPAYVFYLAEAMAEAGRGLGLGDDLADLLTRQTVLGAAELLRASPETPEELRCRVTSPGGTTQAATETLDAREVRASIVAAIQRAAARSRELG